MFLEMQNLFLGASGLSVTHMSLLFHVSKFHVISCKVSELKSSGAGGSSRFTVKVGFVDTGRTEFLAFSF